MLIACRKRPVAIEVLKQATERIERDLFQEFEEEVPTSAIGQRVMDELSQVDTVAYIRFASVYREFQSIADFHQVLGDLQEEVSAKR